MAVRKKVDIGHYTYRGFDILCDVHARTWHAFRDGKRIHTHGPLTLTAVCAYLDRLPHNERTADNDD